MSDRVYEVLFIADQNLGEPEVEALTATIQGFIEKEGGKIQKVEKWGKKRLAYPVKRQREGSYVLVVAEGGAQMVHEVERRYAQRIVVSVELCVRDDYDGSSDRLEDVYDYDRAIRAVKETVDSAHFNLIETLAERIADACLADGAVLAVRVRVDKPDVLPSCRGIGIEIARARPRPPG